MSDIKLKSFTIKGYKSIKSIEGFTPRPINVLIGPNGSGKSNFISFFKFLSWMLNSDGKLQEHVAYFLFSAFFCNTHVTYCKSMIGL